MKMKTISVVVPCYNEEENVEAMADAVREVFADKLTDYRYELIFIDNDSRDRTREIIRRLCEEDKAVKGIFNAKNFGQFNSPYYGMLQSSGDCTILLAADFQDPVEMIPRFVLEWEYGYKIVIGIKTSSKENKLMYWLRGCYYKLIKKFSDVDQIEQFTGFGLYDAEFIEVLRKLDDPTPFLRGIVAELGFRRKEIPYQQPLRRAGKTSNNFYRLYDAAMLSITSYTKAGLRLATIVGGLCCAFFIMVAMVYLVMKLVYWDRFPAGMAPLLIGMCLLGSVQIFFIGMVGEYVLSINQRVMKRPLVVEEERLNFDSAPVKAGGNGKQKQKKKGGQPNRERGGSERRADSANQEQSRELRSRYDWTDQEEGGEDMGFKTPGGVFPINTLSRSSSVRENGDSAFEDHKTEESGQAPRPHKRRRRKKKPAEKTERAADTAQE